MRVDVARPDARSALEVFSLQRHGHAARSTARTRELVPLQLNGVFLRAPRLELRSPEQEIIFVDDVVAVLRELLRGADVSLVKKNDSGRERERVGSVGPLLAL